MPRDKRSTNKKGNEEQGAPAWMTTYGDMVTLLLTFFILLYTFSSIDIQRFQEVMSSIQHSFMGRSGILRGSVDLGAAEGHRVDVGEYSASVEDAISMVGLSEREMEILELLADLQEVYEKARDYLAEAGLNNEIRLHLEERGIVMELPEHFLFDTGRAELKKDFLPILDVIAGFLADIPNQIIVEGHTDNVPISTFLFPSNWELSVTRAVTVARYLVEKNGLDPRRFVATGYGEYHPVASNGTAEGRARNRRVTLVISILKIKNGGME